MAPTGNAHGPHKSELDGLITAFISGNHRNRKTGGWHSQDTRRGSREGVTLSIFEVPPGLLTRRVDERFVSPESSREETDVSGSNQRLLSGIIRTDHNRRKRGLTCIRCNLEFDDRPAQLTHFKTPLHMTNLRRQLVGEPPLSQSELDAEIGKAALEPIVEHDALNNKDGDQAATTQDGATDSSEDEAGEGAIRGQAGSPSTKRNEDNDDYDEDDGLALPAASVAELTQIIARKTSAATARKSRGDVRVDYSLHEGPRLTFNPSGSAWSFSLSSAVLGMERGSDPWERLDLLFGDDSRQEGNDATNSVVSADNRLWAVLIIRSGRFAAGVFEGQTVLCHKVFRRYTIRAKRGGSQSSYDSGGRKARSAGATLRRYGEQSLREDARALLKEWEAPLKACRVILTSVPKALRTVLFDGKDAPFERKDPRIRSVPFAVGKPVFEEVVAVHSRVTSIIFTESSLILQEQTHEDSETTICEGSQVADDSPEDKKEVIANGAEQDHEGDRGQAAVDNNSSMFQEAHSCLPSKELIGACERGDVAAVATLLDRLVISSDGPSGGGECVVGHEEVPSGEGMGALQGRLGGWTAAEVIDRPDGLEQLRTPLHVAAAGGHAALVETLLKRGANPLAKDVRSRLPYMLAQKKDTRDAFRRARAAQPERWDWDAARVPGPLTDELAQRQKEKQKEKEKEKRRRAKQRKKDERANVEAEERERKAKEEAAEAERQAKGLAAVGHCDACGKHVSDKKAFYRFEYRYCSTDCANMHKRRLAADAAERRLNAGANVGK